MRFEPILRKISNGGHFADVIFDGCRAIWCLFKYIKFIYKCYSIEYNSFLFSTLYYLHSYVHELNAKYEPIKYKITNRVIMFHISFVVIIMQRTEFLKPAIFLHIKSSAMKSLVQMIRQFEDERSR
jgi:hypothetical protein